MGERRVGGWRSQSLGNANPIRVIPESWERKVQKKNAYLKRKVGQLPSVSHHIVLWVWWHRWVGPPKKVTRDQLLWLCSLSYCRITYYHSLLLQPLLGKYENFFLFFLGSCNGFSPQFRLLPLQQREATTTTDHSTPFGTESKSQGSWKADLSITLGILFVYWFCFSIWKPRKLLLLCVPESKRAIFPCMQTAKKILHFSWGNQRVFFCRNLTFLEHPLYNKQFTLSWSFISYAKVKSLEETLFSLPLPSRLDIMNMHNLAYFLAPSRQTN